MFNITHTGAVDIGVINILALTFDFGQKPILYRHKHWRDLINQYQRLKGHPQHTKRYHRELKKVQGNLNKIIYRLANQVVADCLFNDVDQLVIGWTSSTDMNPYYQQLLSKLLGEMRQRAHKRGIQTYMIEEGYTSQTSCLDLDELTIIEDGYTLDDLQYIEFSGFRFDRDTYLSSTNKEINADVNSSYNIMIRSQKSNYIITLINEYQQLPRILEPYIKYI